MSGGHLINNEEWQHLRAVDHLARDLYHAIRKRMDFRTGIVGDIKARVSWQGFREDTEVIGRPGVKTIKPSEAQLRRRVAQLAKAGLIEVISTDQYLRFRLLLATRLSRAPKKAVGPPSGLPVPANQGPAQGSGVIHNESSAKADTHQESPVNTLKPTPPNPPVPGHEGEQFVPPTPAARAGELDPPHRRGARAQQLSEQRHKTTKRGGKSSKHDNTSTTGSLVAAGQRSADGLPRRGGRAGRWR